MRHGRTSAGLVAAIVSALLIALVIAVVVNKQSDDRARAERRLTPAACSDTLSALITVSMTVKDATPATLQVARATVGEQIARLQAVRGSRADRDLAARAAADAQGVGGQLRAGRYGAAVDLGALNADSAVLVRGCPA